MTGGARETRTTRLDMTDELYERVPCGYLAAEPDGTIVLANRKIADMVGRPEDELTGRVRLQELMTTGGRIYYETHVSPLLLMQGYVEEIAVDIRGPQGPVPILLNAELRHNSNGEVTGIHASMLDATERRRYERELLAARNHAEEAARLKSEMIAMISHDIRSPLAALSTVEELLELTALSEEQAKYVRMLKSSTGNLLQLVNDVLDLGKIEAGRMRLDKKPTNLHQLVTGLVEEARIEADRKGIAFNAEIDSELPKRVLADSIKLGRILSNLMGNAVKFTEAGEVGVSVRLMDLDEAKARIRFVVWDTGIGISKEQLDRIFEDFTQGSDEIGSRYGGSGLGLGICKRFLELYGAELGVESAAGEGSRFQFDVELDQVSMARERDS